MIPASNLPFQTVSSEPSTPAISITKVRRSKKSAIIRMIKTVSKSKNGNLIHKSHKYIKFNVVLRIFDSKYKSSLTGNQIHDPQDSVSMLSHMLSSNIRII